MCLACNPIKMWDNRDTFLLFEGIFENNECRKNIVAVNKTKRNKGMIEKRIRCKIQCLERKA